MKTITLMILTFLLFPIQTQAFDTWTDEDSNYQLTYTILHVLDWGQTLDIAKHPDTYYEKNYILGRHPSVRDVNAYFTSSLIIHTTISYMLPKEYRRIWQCIWIIQEADSVRNNFGIGLKLNF